MSRSGYSDDCENLELWRGTVLQAIRGKRGQAFMRDLAQALDAMPDKRLIVDDLRREGEVCAIGALGAKRGVNMEAIDPNDPDQVANVFNIAAPLAQEVVYFNDERGPVNETPEMRWTRMRAWVQDRVLS